MDKPRQIDSRVQVRSPHAYPNWLGWLAWGMLLWTISFLLSLASPIISNDETWFLQVIERLGRGEALYRDIFFNVPPLSALIAWLAIKLTAHQLFILRLLQSLYFTLLALSAGWLSRQLGFRPRSVIFIGLALLAYAPPWVLGTGVAYTPLAYLFQLAAFNCLYFYARLLPDQRMERTGIWLLLAAGGLAGLSFASKQTTGMVTLTALGIAMLLLHRQFQRGQIWGRALTILAGFTLAILLIVGIPIIVNGGWTQFLDYGFLNKRTYLAIAGIGYWEGIAALPLLAQVTPSWSNLHRLLLQTQYLLPALALLLIGIGLLITPSRRRSGWVVLVFLCAALLDIFPRVSIYHISCALPMTFVAIGFGWRQTSLKFPRPVLHLTAWVTLVWVCLGLTSLFLQPLELSRQGYIPSILPHLRGVWIEPHLQKKLVRQGERLQRLAENKPILLITPNAAQLYLTGNLINPTPFDYPLATAFGLHGQEQVILSIDAGAIPLVCMADYSDNILNPAKLSGYVTAHLKATKRLPFCNLYTR
jgi:hypothetical protein